ncbi:MAG: protein kinase [Alphaproteobacteria bacterium]|nr:protein kinase [Alphaproteobacteria bacterium]
MNAPDIRTLRPDQLPLRWGRYLIGEVLGEGGLGRVYGAELQGPAGFRKPVALKILRGQRDAMLQAEARLGARLQHANIAQIFDLGQRDGCFFLAMERVEGPDLARLLRQGGPLPGAALVELARQVTDALAYAHALPLDGRVVEVVHRDLKPSNLLVDRQGRVRLVDFGIAAVRGEGNTPRVAGTPGYIAPEQARGEEVSGRADLFALGICLIELATGARPFEADDAEAAWRRLAHPADALRRWGLRAPLEEVCPGLSDVVAGLIALEPRARIPSATALGWALSALRPPEGPGLRAWVEALTRVEDTEELPDARTFTFSDADAPAPVDPSPLVGRAPDLARLGALVERGHRVIALEGPAGVGKSRLARAFGQGSARATRLIDLAEARTLDAALARVANALGLRLPPIEDPEARAGWLGERFAALGPALLILDNVEHLADGLGAVVRAWASRAPDLVQLVTTRYPLAEDAAARLQVEPLKTSDAVALLRALLAAPERFTDAELARVVERLDGLPLAVELAAAQPEALERGGEQLLQHLVGGGAEGSLRAALAWSWSLLEPWERALLAQLSVFRGGFTADAAGRVVDLIPWPEAPWTLFGVEALLDKHLLRATTGGEGGPRFALLHSARVFAAEQLAREGAILDGSGRPWSGADAARAVAHRHGRYFARLGEEGNTRSLSNRMFRLHVDELNAERDNLEVGFERALERGDARVVAGCARAIGQTAHYFGPVRWGSAILRRALAVPGLADDARLSMMFTAAKLLASLGRRQEAVARAQEVVDTARAVGLPVYATEASVFQGYLLAEEDPDRAEPLIREALERLSETAQAQQWALHTLGNIAQARGDIAEGVALLERALLASRQEGDLRCEAATLNVLGLIAKHRQGDLRRALQHYERCARVASRTADQIGLTVALTNLSGAQLVLGLLEEAERTGQDALAACRRTGMVYAEVAVRRHLGELAWLRGDLDGALAWLRSSVDTCGTLGLVHEGLRSRLGLIGVLLGSGSGEPEALLDDTRALSAHPGLEGFRGIGLLEALGAQCLQQRGAEGAVDEAERALTLAEASGYVLMAWEAKARAASVLQRAGQPERAQAIAAAVRAAVAGARLGADAPLSRLLAPLG